MVAPIAAVFFDVDFTLIHPGPRFQSAGYEACCARYGVPVDTSRFEQAVAGAASILDTADASYDPDLFVRYTRRIIELMGGTSPAAEAAARELFDAWADHQHFSIYDDVLETLQALRGMNVRVGLISNSQRCLSSFQSHFALGGLIDDAVSSADHGYMKPHPHIFRAALTRLGVPPAHAVMVGDSVSHDVQGARGAGMRGILLSRGAPPAGIDDVEVIRSLRELPGRISTSEKVEARSQK